MKALDVPVDITPAPYHVNHVNPLSTAPMRWYRALGALSQPGAGKRPSATDRDNAAVPVAQVWLVWAE